MFRAPAGCERVRDVGVDDCHSRLRQVGHRAQPFDHRVQLGCLIAVDDLGPRGSESELVGGVVLEEGQADDDYEHQREAGVQGVEEDDCEDDVEQAEQAGRQEHPQRQSGVTSVGLAFHRESLLLEGDTTHCSFGAAPYGGA